MRNKGGTAAEPHFTGGSRKKENVFAITCDATDVFRDSVPRSSAIAEVQVLHAHGKVHLGDIPCAKEDKSDAAGKKRNEEEGENEERRTYCGWPKKLLNKI